MGVQMYPGWIEFTRIPSPFVPQYRATDLVYNLTRPLEAL